MIYLHWFFKNMPQTIVQLLGFTLMQIDNVELEIDRILYDDILNTLLIP